MSFFLSVWSAVASTVLSQNTSKALAEAGLDWTVEKRRCMRPKADGSLELSNGYSVVRQDRDQELAIVGEKWSPYQNSWAFGMLDPLVEAGLIELSAAGQLFEGGKVFVLAKVLGTDSHIAGRPVDLYILVTNSHGYGALSFGFVPMMRDNKQTLSAVGKIRTCHTGDIQSRVVALRDSMNLATGEFIASVESFEKMQRTGLSSESFKKLVKLVLKKGDVEADEEEDAESKRSKLAKLLERGANVQNVLDAYMVMADYLNSDAAGRNANSIVDSLWYGQGKSLLNRMQKLCKEVADANAQQS
jgi:hypothetical protein